MQPGDQQVRNASGILQVWQMTTAIIIIDLPFSN